MLQIALDSLLAGSPWVMWNDNCSSSASRRSASTARRRAGGGWSITVGLKLSALDQGEKIEICLPRLKCGLQPQT
jgi:hypothetical protein